METVAIAAVEAFMRSATIPLLYEEASATQSIAGGTLFEIAGRHFIITARHIFDDINPEGLAYPEHSMKGVISTLGTSHIYRPKSSSIDVAAVELLEEVTISQLTTGWRFLTLDNIGSPSKDGLFVLVGYPSTLSKQVGGWVGAHGLALYSTPLQGVPPEARDLVPEFDLFFDHKTKAFWRTGNAEADVPALGGTSGSSIWECINPTQPLWMPEQCAKVVGVQSGVFREKYFRGYRWSAVASLLRQVDDALGEQIDAKLG